MSTTSTASIRIDLSIAGQGNVVNVFNIINNAGQRAQATIDALGVTMKSFMGYLSVQKVMQFSDAWENATGQINVATKSLEESHAVQEKLFETAQGARQPFSELVKVYADTERASSNLGASQADLIAFTDVVAKSLTVQHTSTTQARGSLLQLGQAMGMGKLRAQEYNSVIQNMPYLLKQAAINIEGTGGTVNGLRQKMLAGKVTSKELFDGIMASAAKVTSDMEKSGYTFEQTFVKIKDSVSRYIGQLNHANELSKKFGQMGDWVAKNMDLVASSVMAVGAAVVAAFAPGIILMFADAVATLFVFLNANPMIAIASATAAAVVFFEMYGDKLSAGVDATLTMRDVTDQALRDLKEWWKELATIAGEVWDKIIEATAGWGTKTSELFSDVGSGFSAMVRSIARTFDALGGLFIGGFVAFTRIYSGVPTFLADVFGQAYNEVASKMDTITNTVVDKMNWVREKVGKEPIQHVVTPRMKVSDLGAWGNYVDNIKNGLFDRGFEIQGGYMEQKVNDFFARAAANKKTVVDKTSGVDLTTKGTPTAPVVDASAAAKAEKEYEKLKNQLRQLLNTIDPTSGAILEQAKAFDTLTKAFEKGMISPAEYNNYLAATKEHFKDLIDPVGAYVRDLDDQISTQEKAMNLRKQDAAIVAIENELKKKNIDLNSEENATARQMIETKLAYLQTLKANGAIEKWTKSLQDEIDANTQLIDDRKVLQGMLQLENSLKQINHTLSVQERADAEELLRIQIESARVAGQRDALESSSNTAAMKDYKAKLKAAKELEANPSSGVTKADTNASFVNADTDLFAGTQAQIDAKMQRYELMYQKIDAWRGDDVKKERDAAIMKGNVDAMLLQTKVAQAQSLFGTLASLSTSHNKRIAAIGKAAAISEAIINTYVGATKALAQGGIYGSLMAAAVVAQGLMQVSQIRSQNTGYKTGGYTGNGGIDDVAGVVHGKEFVMNAAATSRLGVQDLQALQSGNARIQRGNSVQVQPIAQPVAQPVQTNVNVPVTAVVVQSREQALAAMKSADGKAFIMETIEQNGDTLAKIVGTR